MSGEIFLVTLTLRYKGRTLTQFQELLLKQVNHFKKLSDKEGMKLAHSWMGVGENKMYMFVEGSGDLLDKFLMEMPLMKELGSQIQSDVIALYSYETFANSINAVCETDKRYEASTFAPIGNSVYYLLDVDVQQRGLDQKALLDIWLQEIEAALGAKKRNLVVDIWKSVAMRRLLVLICVDSPVTMDMISFGLPMMKLMGENMFITTKRLRKFQEMYADLK